MQRILRTAILILGTVSAGMFGAFRGPVSAQSAGVSIVNFSFSPGTLNVPVGTTVQWTNLDSAAHTATSDTRAFDSGTLFQNRSFSFTFTQAGTFPYHCAVHPDMLGVIVVGGGASATSTPAPTSTTAPTSSSPTTVPASATPVPPTATSAPLPTQAPLSTFAVKTSGTPRVGKRGTVRLTVRDQDGRVVSGAQVSANLRGIGIKKTVTKSTNGKGEVTLTCLPKKAGKVKITISKDGFTARTVAISVHA